MRAMAHWTHSLLQSQVRTHWLKCHSYSSFILMRVWLWENGQGFIMRVMAHWDLAPFFLQSLMKTYWLKCHSYSRMSVHQCAREPPPPGRNCAPGKSPWAAWTRAAWGLHHWPGCPGTGCSMSLRAVVSLRHPGGPPGTFWTPVGETTMVYANCGERKEQSMKNYEEISFSWKALKKLWKII